MSGPLPALELLDIAKTYRVGSSMLSRKHELRAVRNVSLTLPHREVVGLVGESGCGKSTLAKILLGLEQPTSGSIRIFGRALEKISRKELSRIVQPVFQDPYSSLNPSQPIGVIISMPLVIHGLGDRRQRRMRAEEMMEKVGLSPALYYNFPGQLSGGQRQRVAIARALMLEPRILVCDEPTSALDVSVQAQILNLLQQLHRDLDLSIILISHNLAVVQHLARKVAVMYLGRIVEEGSSSEIFNHPRHPYTKALLDSNLAPTPDQTLPDLALLGEFPDPVNAPSGCSFHPRCKNAKARCSEEVPPLTDDNGRRAACYFPN